jgi:CBS-domain-containing membrane protein
MQETPPTPQAKDFMTDHVYCITPEMSLAQIIQFLDKHQIANAPVVEQQGEKRILVGFVSERNCLECLANESFFGSLTPPQTAATIMRRHPVCVQPETEMFTLASIFVNHGYRDLPVVGDGQLLGIVSRRDILKAMNHYYEQRLKEKDHEHHLPDYSELMQQRFVVSG